MREKKKKEEEEVAVGGLEYEGGRRRRGIREFCNVCAAGYRVVINSA
jgi:hypothetical protein